MTSELHARMNIYNYTRAQNARNHFYPIAFPFGVTRRKSELQFIESVKRRRQNNHTKIPREMYFVTTEALLRSPCENRSN